jgi:hypothetical protein
MPFCSQARARLTIFVASAAKVGRFKDLMERFMFWSFRGVFLQKVEMTDTANFIRKFVEGVMLEFSAVGLKDACSFRRKLAESGFQF